MEATNLEENFKLFYRIAKNLILYLRDDDKVLAAQWLRKLAACQSAADSELRNHYMTLLLVVLQQRRIVGPFKKPPGVGTELERFSKDYQPEDMQALINEELLKQPAPPLVQFAMAGGDKLTEFAVSQEIPKFGVHFYYVCSMEPIYDFQRRNQAKIPRGLMGPTRSTIKDLNAGIEELLRSEKKKLKVTIDKTGKKQIKIRDENVLGGGGRTRAMPKHLRARLGAAAAPAPSAPAQEAEVEIPLTTFVEQPSPPRRPASRPVASRPGLVRPTRGATAAPQQVDLQNPSIAVAVKAGAAVANLETAAEAVAGPSTRPTGAIPKVKAPTVKQRTGQLRVPATAPGQPAQVQPARGLRQPARAGPQTRAPGRGAPQPRQRTPEQPIQYTTPYRFTPHPWASPTPPVFKYGARHEGAEYEPQQFGVPAAEKFAVPHRKIKALKWTPSRRGVRPQMRDILRKHPIPDEVRQITEVAERPYISTPEVEAEVHEQLRREHLVEQADERTSRLMARFYAGKSLVPRALDYAEAVTPVRPAQVVTEEDFASRFEPYLLDDTPVTEDELIAEEEMDFGDDLFAGAWGGAPAEAAESPEMLDGPEEAQAIAVSPSRIAVATPTHQSPIAVGTPTPPRIAVASPQRQSPAAVTPPRPPQIFVEEATPSSFLADEDIYLIDDQDYAFEASPMSLAPPSPRTPVQRQMATPVTPTTRIAEARRLFLTTMTEDAPPTSPPRASPGGTTARLVDVPIQSPLPSRSPGVPEFDILTSPKTPEKMDTKVNFLLNAIEAQVEAHKQLIGEVSEMPRTPSLDNLVTELSHGNDALQRLRLNFEAIKEARAQKPPSPAQEQPVESAMPAQLTLDLQNLSDLVEGTKEGAEMLQEIAETAEDPVVQEAAQQSLETSQALAEISNQMQHLTTLWEQSMALEGSSLGLLDEQDISGGGDLFGEDAAASPLQATVDQMVETLDQSIKDVISGDASPQELQTQLRDFQQALKDIDVEGSLLEGSQPIDDLLQSTNDLETSIQMEAAAVEAVTNTPERASLLERSEAVIEDMNDILELVAPQAPPVVSTVPTPQRMAIASRLETLRQAQRQTAARPEEGTLVLTAMDEAAHRHVVDHPGPFAINWEDEQEADILDDNEMAMDDLVYEHPGAPAGVDLGPEILDESFMQTDDMFGNELVMEPRQWTPTASPVAGPSGVQQQMLNLLVETQQQQESLLNASLAVRESSYDVAAVAASQQVARKMMQNQAAVAQMINQIQAGDENFGWLGPMEQVGKGRVPAARGAVVRGPPARGPARGAQAPGARQVPQRAPTRQAPVQTRPVTRPATAGQQMPRKTTIGLQRPTASRTAVTQAQAAAARQAAGAVPRPVKRPGTAPTATTTAPPAAAAAAAKPPPIRRPPGGAAQAPAVRQQQQVAPQRPQAGTAPKPRAGYAEPVPVRRPPQPIPLPAGGSAGSSTTQLRPSPSVRAMLPRPGPVGGPASKRR